ncbi:MAG: hypothetical protein JO010_01665 [Alphaproteobacteria bacterium]|nr:hypothetical protein [Alphaproteobacteria bacterium]
MSPEFLRAIIDTLLPGMGAPEARGGMHLPSGSEAGIDLARHAASARPILDAIAVAAGGAAAFAGASEAARAAILRRVERDRPDPFRAFVTLVLAEYYETPAVLTALGWRAAPPQPMGHPLPAMDAETERRLDRVRRRAPLWRA